MLEAPQLVTDSRMLYFTSVPADPDAVRALVAVGARPGRELPVLHEPVDSQGAGRRRLGGADLARLKLNPHLLTRCSGGSTSHASDRLARLSRRKPAGRSTGPQVPGDG